MRVLIVTCVESSERCAHTAGVVDGTAGQGAGAWEAAADRVADVAQSDSNQLLGCVHCLSVGYTIT